MNWIDNPRTWEAEIWDMLYPMPSLRLTCCTLNPDWGWCVVHCTQTEAEICFALYLGWGWCVVPTYHVPRLMLMCCTLCLYLLSRWQRLMRGWCGPASCDGAALQTECQQFIILKLEKCLQVTSGSEGGVAGGCDIWCRPLLSWPSRTTKHAPGYQPANSNISIGRL